MVSFGRAVGWGSAVGFFGATLGAWTAWRGAGAPDGPDLKSALAWVAFAELTRAALAHRSTSSSQAVPQPQQGRRRQRPKEGRSQLKGAALLPLCVLAYASLAVLLGAPALERRDETLTLACLLTLLTAAPTCLLGGAEAAFSLLIPNGNGKPAAHQENDPLEAFRRSVAPTLVGAWAGAAVIPLDWDRPWQAWPLPCFIGALLAHAAVQLYSLAVLLKPRPKI